MSRPRLLDLFCGGGGAAVGYHRAGFDVVGVDHVAQPNYPFSFTQGDALELLELYLDTPALPIPFDAIHASPPCQAYTQAKHIGNRGRNDHPDLLAATRELLRATDLPYVIENVPNSPMEQPVTICGSSMGLRDLERHRWFETNWYLMAAPCVHGIRGVARFPSTPRVDGSERVSRIVNLMAKGVSHEMLAAAMEIDWMPPSGRRPTAGLRNAIPPAYTEFIGHQLLAHIQGEGSSLGTPEGKPQEGNPEQSAM